MSIWGNTEAWAGNRPHKILHSDGDRCNRCPKRGKLVRQKGGSRGGDMEMIESGTNQLLKVWRCVECGRIWFSRPGMLGFFAIQQVSKDEMRILQ